MWSFILSRDGKDACIGMNRSLEGHGLTSLKRTYWTKHQKQKQQAIHAGIERRGIQLFYHVVNAAFVVWRRGTGPTGKRVQGLMPLCMYMVFTSLWCGGSHLWSGTREDALQRLGGEYNARDQDVMLNSFWWSIYFNLIVFSCWIIALFITVLVELPTGQDQTTMLYCSLSTKTFSFQTVRFCDFFHRSLVGYKRLQVVPYRTLPTAVENVISLLLVCG